jgi:peptide chain release factor 2
LPYNYFTKTYYKIKEQNKAIIRIAKHHFIQYNSIIMNIEILEKHIEASNNFLKKQKADETIKSLLEKTNIPDFWDTPQEAQKIASQLSTLQKTQKTWKDMSHTLENLKEIKEILSEQEFELEYNNLEQQIHKARIDLFLSGEYDNNNAIVTLTVGAGGLDANDWTEMVFKMLLKYCEKNTWKTEILDTQTAESVGIKSAVFRVYGAERIYGLLKSESGTHRLVRPSPFNAKNSRETSFVQVEIVPEIQNNDTITIEEKDLRIDTFRAQGAGGQHINTTDSAIRITHIPTGIVVQCQNQRSQHQNKESAMKVLSSRLAERQRKEQEEKQQSLKSEKVHASFGGGHIRSYVLDDRYVKDLRTGIKTSQVEKVLHGDLQNFVEGFISFYK